ncbi:MAG: MarR family EPS-associated transcriptional regulator [Candidatus Omnitrophota bacterium]
MNEHTLREDIFNILRILSSNVNLTQRDLSSHLGFSLGKTNYLIQELAKKGLVKIINFPHRDHKLKRISYNLTPEGWKQKAELTLHFLKRKQEEYEKLRKEWEGLEDLSLKSGGK